MSQVMVVLFGGQGTSSLATTRHNTFINKVVSAMSFVTTERLLSTECVTKLNFRWAYYRVMMRLQFLTSSNCSLAQYTPFSDSSPIAATSVILYHLSSLTPSYVQECSVQEGGDEMLDLSVITRVTRLSL